MRRKVNLIYQKLHRAFGPQHWWPAESSFEVIVGAILTQSTSWKNGEKAIGNLKKHKVLTAKKLYRLKSRKLATYIRPAGYYNIKTKRLKAFLKFFFEKYRGNLKRLSQKPLLILRQELLAVNGIGPESADSILLYALGKPAFVVDAYTKRIFSRHRLIKESVSYDETQDFFRQNLKNEVKLFNEYHALLVKLGKDYCLKRIPRCAECPLKNQK